MVDVTKFGEEKREIGIPRENLRSKVKKRGAELKMQLNFYSPHELISDDQLLSTMEEGCIP